MTFDDFVRAVALIPDEKANPHSRSQVDFLIDDQGTWLPTWIGLMEQLDRNVGNLEALFPNLKLPIERKNVTQRSKESDPVPAELKNLIFARYKDDTLLFRALTDHLD